MTEVMAGRIDFFFGPVGLVLSLIRDGKLAALTLNGATRSAALPGVPTTQEAGFVDAEYPIWIGVFLPASVSRDVVERLHREMDAALKSPKVSSKLLALGVDPMSMTTSEFDAYVRKEIVLNARLVKAIGLKAE
jgi:tripartite-type tricarboxylate transporter receptor subunit TctC